MPVCEVCQADGIVCVNNHWYCALHIEDAFAFLGRTVATILNWDEDETEEQLREWFKE